MKRSRLLPGVIRSPAVRPWAWLGLLGFPVLLALASAGGAAGQQSDERVSAVECCQNVLVPLAARAVALGQAAVADTAADAFFYNPAGLSRLLARRVEVYHTPLPDQVQFDAVSLLLRPWGVGALGITYELLDFGEQQGTDTNNNPTGTFFEQDHLLAATFAAELAAGVSGGLTYKLFVVHASCSPACKAESGSTAMVDAGVQFHPRRAPWLAAGASLQNAGLPLQIVNKEQADPTPLRVRAGASVQALHFVRADTTLALWVSGQLEGSGLEARDPVLALGAQLSVGEVMRVRTGYRGGTGSGAGLSLGVGFSVDRFVLDIAKPVTTTALAPEGTFYVSLGILLDRPGRQATQASPPEPSRRL
ncbi:MAG: PorV/PorQ family protein [Gemmatimonadetes bacterium]|nr:PorV/PorQ family protein [Gemmatimonadota bacterium]